MQAFFLLASVALLKLQGEPEETQLLEVCGKLTSQGAGGTQDLIDLGVNGSKPRKG